MSALVLDRLEGDTAYLEAADGTLLALPTKALPEGAREGDVLSPQGEGYAIDHEATQARRDRLASLRAAILSKEDETP